MPNWQFTKGLHDLGNGSFAYLQPDGSWGWSNAGLITDGDQAMLVDTLFDGHLTAEMLRVMRSASPAAKRIGTLVNTHSNGDHCFGNGLVPEAEIIASAHAVEEMDHESPEFVAQLLRDAPSMGAVGQFLIDRFGMFDFGSIKGRAPDRTFTGTLVRQVGDKEVRLVEVGPAHTGGDVIVHVPADRVVYTGDILFIGGTPVMWAGPVDNWITACETIMAMDVEAIVPGHGPITDKAGVGKVRDYFVFLKHEARLRFDAGMSATDAARDIALGEFGTWGEVERTVVNIHSLYREFDPTLEPAPVMEMMQAMCDYAIWSQTTAPCGNAACGHDHG